jgi:cell division protein FtsL
MMAPQEKKTRFRKTGRWVALVLAAALLYSLFSGKSNVVRMYRSHTDIKKKEAAVASRHHEIDSLTAQNAKLKSDTAYIEKIAREKLGMARKDEKVYKFIEESK